MYSYKYYSAYADLNIPHLPNGVVRVKWNQHGPTDHTSSKLTKFCAHTNNREKKKKGRENEDEEKKKEVVEQRKSKKRVKQ